MDIIPALTLVMSILETSAYVNQGDTFVMTCLVLGHPKPTVNWYKDGTLVQVTGQKKAYNPVSLSFTVVTARVCVYVYDVIYVSRKARAHYCR